MMASAEASIPAGVASQHMLDNIWILIAAALVMLMQVGFLLLEAGMVRSKNSINVAMKNMLDFAVSTLAFALVGFMVAFGASGLLPMGLDWDFFALRGLDENGLVFFLFQVMFCGTAATIVAGGVAERMRLSAYTISSIVIGALIYPVFAHWAWGNAFLLENTGAFLCDNGFMDFAGSTVVHGTGGWLTLAACLVLGARKGRFNEHGEPVRFSGHSTVLASGGAFLLFIGWIGFNGGSTLAADTSISSIIVNTILAGAAGTAAGYVWTMSRDLTVLPEKVLTGMIGGLVGVTAGCAIMNTDGALAIGVIGAIGANAANEFVERQLRIDDAVGAIGAHGVAGVLGTVLMAFLAPVENLPLQDRMAQFQIQSIGACLNFVWAFGMGYALFAGMKFFFRIRVSAEAEEMGLNASEHDTRIGVGHVEDAMGHLVRGTADLNTRLPVEPGDEAERLVLTFNALLDNLQREENARSNAVENKRAKSEAERLSALADATFEALCLCVRGRVIEGNASLERLLGVELRDLRGRSLTEYISDEDFDALIATCGDDAHSAKEITIHNAAGQSIPVEVRGRDVTFRNETTRVLAIVDLRERKKAEDRIRYLAQHDSLTGLPNRAVFNERLTSMIERTVSTGDISAVILIDLDRFKDVNDLHGHGAGDEVLKATSERLQSLISTRDTAARLGGDEFAILQIDINFTNQAADLAMRIIEAVNQPIVLSDGNAVNVGASVGIAMCPRDGTDNVSLITRADIALYKSKSAGRNRYAIFEAGMDEHVRRRQLLELDLAEAFEKDEFQLHYQPRLNARTGKITSYEALMRWSHPERGDVSPADFIPVAEGCGLIVRLGAWVIREACKMAQSNLRHESVSVNVSPLQFRENGFVDSVRDALEETGLQPERLEIEVTENVLIDDDHRALRVFNALHQLGVRIALDDFGTGYSSLGYLSRFPYDAIKIDRSFVANMDENRNGIEIIDTIIRLGRALNMQIVVEGVETLSGMALLVQSGCDEIQGYVVGSAKPQDQLLKEAPREVMTVLNAERARREFTEFAEHTKDSGVSQKVSNAG
ncbi:ammonium transporter [Ponticaulis sp.]|uniref:ammonium transporter n=1 Tax=Ponticaulis sp. TaxID=2020902 RepID=UPI0025FEEE7C|nr:ammonium transporter [Ponticaulis sp.]